MSIIKQRKEELEREIEALKNSPTRRLKDYGKESINLAVLLHQAYEKYSDAVGWRTQGSCKGKAFSELPKENQETMILTASYLRWLFKVEELKAELKGITFAQADEIKWLEEQVRVIDNCVNKPEFADLKKDIQDRINELK